MQQNITNGDEYIATSNGIGDKSPAVSNKCPSHKKMGLYGREDTTFQITTSSSCVCGKLLLLLTSYKIHAIPCKYYIVKHANVGVKQ